MEITFVQDSDIGTYSCEPFKLTGDCILTVTLPSEGRIVIKKSNDNVTFHTVLSSPQAGPEFTIRLYGESKGKYISIHTSLEPSEVTLTPISKDWSPSPAESGSSSAGSSSSSSSSSGGATPVDLSGISAAIEEMSTAISGISTAVTAIGDMSTTITDMSSAIGDMSTTISGMSTAVDNVSTTIGNMSTTIDNMSDAIGEMSDAIEDISTTIGDIPAVMDEIIGEDEE